MRKNIPRKRKKLLRNRKPKRQNSRSMVGKRMPVKIILNQFQKSRGNLPYR